MTSPSDGILAQPAQHDTSKRLLSQRKEDRALSDFWLAVIVAESIAVAVWRRAGRWQASRHRCAVRQPKTAGAAVSDLPPRYASSNLSAKQPLNEGGSATRRFPPTAHAMISATGLHRSMGLAVAERVGLSPRHKKRNEINRSTPLFEVRVYQQCALKVQSRSPRKTLRAAIRPPQ